jgi:NADH-quinone oxidoreductase subunit L
MYVARPGMADRLAGRFPGLHALVRNKYFVDETYDALMVHPVLRASRELLWQSLDVKVVDGAVNGAGRMVRAWSGILKGMQNGLARSYAAWILLGAAALLGFLMMQRG